MNRMTMDQVDLASEYNNILHCMSNITLNSLNNSSSAPQIHTKDLSRGKSLAGVDQEPAAKERTDDGRGGVELVSVHEDSVHLPIRGEVLH